MQSCALLITSAKSVGKYIELTSHNSEEDDWDCNRVLAIGVYADGNKHPAIIAIDELPLENNFVTRVSFVLTWNNVSGEYAIDRDWCQIIRRIRGELYVTVPNVRRIMDGALNPK